MATQDVNTLHVFRWDKCYSYRIYKTTKDANTIENIAQDTCKSCITDTISFTLNNQDSTC